MKKLETFTAIFLLIFIGNMHTAIAQSLTNLQKEKLLKLFYKCSVAKQKSDQCKSFRNGMRYVRLIENLAFANSPPSAGQFYGALPIQENYLCKVLPQNCNAQGGVVTFLPPGPSVYNTQPAWYYETVVKALSSEKDPTKKQKLLRNFFESRPTGSILSTSQWNSFLSGVDGSVKELDHQSLVKNLQKFDQGVSLNLTPQQKTAPGFGFGGINAVGGNGAQNQ